MIFISYRRSDTGGHAGRLFDRLRQWFDKDALFYDQDGIDIGEIFPASIEAAIGRATVVLVLVGPGWLTEINLRAGQPGIDFVRREVELGLQRRAEGVLVLPVLLGGATMPAPHELHIDLQACLAPLCAGNGHEFTGTQADWENQFVRLRERIARVPGTPAPRFRAPAGTEQPFHLIEHLLSPYFQDPSGLLARLHQQLTAAGGGARAALCGMGGIGKTQLALKYSRDYQDVHAGVWWFRAESETTLQLDAQACCQAVNAEIQPGEVPAIALKRWLEHQETCWLLVFDNAEDSASLRPYLPESGKHHLIITSRNPAWGGLAQPFELDIWTTRQSMDFLAVRLQVATQGDLQALALDLGGLPLALEQAASYMEETGTTVADYRNLLADINTEGLVLDEGRAATGYERSLAAALSLSFQKLTPAAQQLLRLCAFAAPEPLPECFFREAAETLPPDLANTAANPLAWNKVAGELRRYALAQRVSNQALNGRPGEADQRSEPALLLHRLTQQTVRARLAQANDDCRAFQALLTKCCPADFKLPANWPRYAWLAPHVTQLDRYCSTGWLDLLNFSRLLDDVANYLGEGPALYSDAAHWSGRSFAINRRELGDEHQETLHSMNSLASALRDQGDLPGARALQESVLAISRRVQGEEHPNTLTAMNQLAGTLLYQGDLPAARVLQEQVLATTRRTLGEEHPNTASMNNLAITLLRQGDLIGARELQERALADNRQTLGDEHPATLVNLGNLASTLLLQGDLAIARALQEKVLDAQRRLLGKGHPDTLTSMNNLALTLRRQKNLPAAHTLQVQVLATRRRIQGDEHPDTLTSMNNLSITLWRMKEYEAAQRMMQAAAAGRVRVLGANHPDAVGSLEDAEQMLVKIPPSSPALSPPPPGVQP